MGSPRPKHVANFDTQSNIITRVVFDWLFFDLLLLQHTTGWTTLRLSVASYSCDHFQYGFALMPLTQS
jgi:hypothetical protein